MMMGQSRASSRPFAKLLFAFVACVLVVTFGTPLRTYVRGVFATFAPRVTDEMYAGLSNAELVERLKKTEAELESVRYQSVLYGLVVEENRELSEASSLQSFSKVIPARVLSRPPQTVYDSLLLDRGTDSGIKEKDLVAIEGVALGRIVSVGNSFSTVQLFSTAGATHDAILGIPRAVAVVTGLGGGSFSVSLPRSVTVDVGEPVRIPNSETLIIGRVVSVEGAGTDATQIAYIASPVSMQSLDFVSIIPQNE